ncbi:hypothetical protein ACFSUK_27355 [Sphingobium scionense]
MRNILRYSVEYIKYYEAPSAAPLLPFPAENNCRDGEENKQKQGVFMSHIFRKRVLNPWKAGSAMSCMAVAIICGTPQAQAQEQDQGEIVVTALKRNTRVQDTPIAITAVTGASLEAYRHHQLYRTDPRYAQPAHRRWRPRQSPCDPARRDGGGRTHGRRLL